MCTCNSRYRHTFTWAISPVCLFHPSLQPLFQMETWGRMGMLETGFCKPLLICQEFYLLCHAITLKAILILFCFSMSLIFVSLRCLLCKFFLGQFWKSRVWSDAESDLQVKQRHIPLQWLRGVGHCTQRWRRKRISLSLPISRRLQQLPSCQTSQTSSAKASQASSLTM